MQLSRRAVCAAALLGVAGCISDGSDPAGELDPDVAPERPDELTSESVADYVERYERTYLAHEGIDRSGFADPDEAVSVNCAPTVFDADDEDVFYGLVQCAGRIQPDVGDAIELRLGLPSAPLYRVSADATRRISPKQSGLSSGDDEDPTLVTSVSNFSERERDVALTVDPAGGEPTTDERTLAPYEAHNVAQVADVASTLDVTVAVDGGEERTVERSVDDGDAVGVFVFVDPDGEPFVGTTSPAEVAPPDNR